MCSVLKKQAFHHSDTVIIIFAREPVPGQVKTRLIPALGEKGAAKLYQRLLKYSINNVVDGALSAVNVCVTPESDKNYFFQMTGSVNFKLSVQAGKDLGTRMYNALAQALNYYSKAILIGTDCPFLSLDDLQQAINALDNNDMVFSPANDGGYVLVGAKKTNSAIFEHIDWGTNMVMVQTRTALVQHKISWQELTEQYDIDIEDDLRKLLVHNKFKHFVEV